MAAQTGQGIKPVNAPRELACAVQHFEGRFNHENKRILGEVTGDSAAEPSNAQATHALVYTKLYTQLGALERVTLAMHSQHIRDAVRAVIGTYPEQNLTARGFITLTATSEWDALACLYHYRRGLSGYARGLENDTAREHVKLLGDFMGRFRTHAERFEDNLAAVDGPSVEFGDIWMLFKPGDLVFGGSGPETFINKVVKCQYSPGSALSPPHWTITTKAFAHNGTGYGYLHRAIQIMSYRSVRPLANLPVLPLNYHKEPATLQDAMIARGRKYCELTGIQYQSYAGEATFVDKEQTGTALRSKYSYPVEARPLHGRIVLDAKSFIDERHDGDIRLQESRFPTSSNGADADADVTTEELLLTHFSQAGFSLSEKRWAYFHIASIQPVDFDDGAFEALMLPAKQKRLVRALTTRTTTVRPAAAGPGQNNNAADTDGFDDLIRGKGKGCVFLLHGEPGIGKTFTAESIADEIRRPLYVLMSGELGTDVASVDSNLRRVLRLVVHWRAVLLIDEADVFLERRGSSTSSSGGSLERNSLVSIFLRTLEYFSGVLFLTTNRVRVFDPAFQSRIHLALRYKALDPTARARLWRLFLARTPGYDPAAWPRDTLADLAAAHPVNGRQIKNTVRTAHALAAAEGAAFAREHVLDVLETVAEFERDFNNGDDADADADGSSVELGYADVSGEGLM